MSHKGHCHKTVTTSVLTRSRPVSRYSVNSFDDSARRFPWHAVFVVIAMTVLVYIVVCAYGGLAGR